MDSNHIFTDEIRAKESVNRLLDASFVRQKYFQNKNTASKSPLKKFPLHSEASDLLEYEIT